MQLIPPIEKIGTVPFVIGTVPLSQVLVPYTLGFERVSMRWTKLDILKLIAIVLPCAFALSPQQVSAQPAKVTVGAYVNDIQAINLREHSYAADVYLWFRWTDKSISPHETVEMLNPNELWGHVTDKIYEEPVQLPNGELYQVLRIQGRFSRKFFFDNYPFDRQELTIEFEDSANETNRMLYVADESPVAINPRLKLPGFRVSPPELHIEEFCYPTTFGDTRRTESHCYSRVQVSVPIHRPALTTSIKLLLPVFCVVLGASIMLRLRVNYVDARIGTGITALLTVVAIQLASNDTMPNVDYLVMMDKIHLCAYGYVLAGLGVVLATIRRADRGDVESANELQRKGFWTITTLFVAVVVCLLSYAIWKG
jgi:hypothetical protein